MAQKLWLGFGLLLLIIVVIGVVSLYHIWQIDRDLRQVVEIEEPLEQAVLEMEINAGETARAVLDYVREPETEHLEEMRDSEANFKHFAARFERLAETDEKRRLGRKVAGLYAEFKVLGDAIVVLADQRKSALQAFRTSTEAVDGLIDGKLKPLADGNTPSRTGKLESAADMVGFIDKTFPPMEAYLVHRDPALLQAFHGNPARFDGLVARYRENGVSAEEADLLDRIKRQFTDAMAIGIRVMAIVDQLDLRLDELEEYLKKIDTVLDDEIQPLIHAETVKAAQDAITSTGRAAPFLIALAAIAVVFGSVWAWALTRQIIGPIQLLVSGAEAVGGGRLAHRIDIKSKDEFGLLAAAFNHMVANLGHVRDQLVERQGWLQAEVAERERAEDDLRKSERRFKAFAEAATDWFWEMDENLRFSYFSDRFSEVAGIDPADLLGKTREETGIPDVDPDQWETHLANLAAHRPFRDFRHARTHSDGRVVHLLINGKPVFDEAGRFRGYRGTGTDVTTEVAAEARAKIAQNRLRDAIENLSEGFSLYDSEDRLVVVNNRYREMYAVDADLLVPGVSFEEQVRGAVEHGHIAQAVGHEEEWITERLRQHHELKEPIEQQLSDGTWLLITERRTGDGGIVTVRADITELRRREKELAEKQAILEATFDAIDQGITMFDADLKLAANNSRFLKLLDLPPEDFQVGTSYQAVVRFRAERGEYGPGDVEEIVRERVALMTRREPLHVERTRPNGTVIEYIRYPLPQGGTVTTYTDITERKRAEAAMVRLHQTQKMEALGEMAGGVAHEFNNLHTIIGGFARMGLKNVENSGRVRDCLEEVITASDRATDVSRQMLVFSRGDVGEVKVMNVGEELMGLQKMVGSLIDSSIVKRIEIEDRQANVEIDPVRFGQAIVNLAINARDAMPKGGTLTIGCHLADFDGESCTRHRIEQIKPGRYVRIFVRDTGSGIDPTVLDHIFEPFFTTKKAEKGTGLGLSMVFGMVKQSAGYLDVESTFGSGTTFSIYLPVSDRPPSQEHVTYTEDTVSQGETILLAEDESQLRDLAATTLEELGYRVLAAPDGITAAALQDEHAGHIDLLLTDIVMPNMGGLELADLVAAERPKTKVVYMTGYSAEFGAQLKDLGDDCLILRKPFEPAGLSRMVRQALDT